MNKKNATTHKMRVFYASLASQEASSESESTSEWIVFHYAQLDSWDPNVRWVSGEVKYSPDTYMR